MVDLDLDALEFGSGIEEELNNEGISNDEYDYDSEELDDSSYYEDDEDDYEDEDGYEEDEDEYEDEDYEDDEDEVSSELGLDLSSLELSDSVDEDEEDSDESTENLLVEDIDNLLHNVKYTRTYEEVPIESLVVSETRKNIRVRTVKGLTASISDMGRVLNPIDVMKLPSVEGDVDRYMVISGLRRMYGAIRNNHSTIPAFVWEFADFENASKLAFLLGLVINKQQDHDMQEIWTAMQHLEREYNLKPAQVERLFPHLNGGDAMRLKDVALGEYEEPRDLLFSGDKTLDQAYKLLQKMRKEEDALELEDSKGILSDTDLAQDTVLDDENEENTLSPDEVLSILEMEESTELTDEDMFNESADAGHHQDRKGDGDDDLSPEAKNRIKMRDQMICRACARLEEKDEDGKPYTKINPEKVNDAAGFNALLTVHHIIPVHAGGTDDDENLVTLCILCHHRLHVMEKMGTIMVDEVTFKKMSKEMQHEIKAAYYYARKAIRAGKLKGYSRKQRQEMASSSLRHKFPATDLRNDTALLQSMK